MDLSNSKKVTINGYTLELSHLSKLFWPHEGITKADVINYYQRIYPYIIPYLKDRLQSLRRNPNGVLDQGFFQKEMKDLAPYWLKTIAVYAPAAKRKVHYLVCEDLGSIIFILNLGCIELNPWNSRVGSLDKPDYCVLDLDPGTRCTFEEVTKAALLIKDIADAAHLPVFCKTSGGRGLHIYIPLGAKYNFAASRMLARAVALKAIKHHPELITLERSLKKRPQDRIYIDGGSNKQGQTVAVAYCIRPRPGAPVSTPLKWEELTSGVNPQDFNMFTVFNRLKQHGDLFEGVLGRGIDLQKAMDLLT